MKIIARIAKWLRHRLLKPTCAGSNPAAGAKLTLPLYEPYRGKQFDFDRDIAWGTKRINPDFIINQYCEVHPNQRLTLTPQVRGRNIMTCAVCNTEYFDGVAKRSNVITIEHPRCACGRKRYIDCNCLLS